MMLNSNAIKKLQLPYLFSNCLQISLGKRSFKRCFLLFDATSNNTVLQNKSFKLNAFSQYGSYQSLRFYSSNIDRSEDLGANITKKEKQHILNKFATSLIFDELESNHGIDIHMARRSLEGFKKFCMDSKIPPDLQFLLYNIHHGSCQSESLLPYFMNHVRTMFPQLDCMDDLKKISDLTQPTSWYPEARSRQRRVIYHAGPTNSGGTYHALQRFTTSGSAIYCAPLKLLANEVSKKTNASGTKCDLITGEERKYVNESGEPSNHNACTVEMANLIQSYEVAVIDEIQMVRDVQRGWAWTNAFLGVCADEVHVCGEESGVDLIRDLTIATGDIFEVRRYNRLTKLKVLPRGIDSFNKIRRGDCIVCFNKNDIYHVSTQLEKRGVEASVIYGTLPPGTKLAQAEKFNDPNNPCKVLVATDAIGMGLNLSIKRVIFYSLSKMSTNTHGEREVDLIPPSSALQIAGRAGRFLTQFPEGEVTTFNTKDLATLNKLLTTSIDPIQKAGLAPTSEQMESFASHLPKTPLSSLIDMFVKISKMDDSKYFMCNMDDFKFLADMIQHIPLNMSVRYKFCCSPIPRRQSLACDLFQKFARQFSRGQPTTVEWVCGQVGWPPHPPVTIKDLIYLEGVCDVFDLYLWLSYRFPDMFPDPEKLRKHQRTLDEIIQGGVSNIVKLLTSEGATPVDYFEDADTPGSSKRNQSRPLMNTEDNELRQIKSKLTKKEKSTDCDSALIPLLCVHG